MGIAKLLKKLLAFCTSYVIKLNKHRGMLITITKRNLMTSLNAVELEFFELAPSIRETITEEGKNLLLKKLLKLNNPTYYVKHITKNPIERHGFSSSRTTNPLLISIGRMIMFCKTCSSLELLTEKLQQEFAWAYHKFSQYKQVDL